MPSNRTCGRQLLPDRSSRHRRPAAPMIGVELIRDAAGIRMFQNPHKARGISPCGFGTRFMSGKSWTSAQPSLNVMRIDAPIVPKRPNPPRAQSITSTREIIGSRRVHRRRLRLATFLQLQALGVFSIASHVEQKLLGKRSHKRGRGKIHWRGLSKTV